VVRISLARHRSLLVRASGHHRSSPLGKAALTSTAFAQSTCDQNVIPRTQSPYWLIFKGIFYFPLMFSKSMSIHAEILKQVCSD
jgi:hypothetical protein